MLNAAAATVPIAGIPRVDIPVSSVTHHRQLLPTRRIAFCNN